MREGINLGMKNLKPQLKEEDGREKWYFSEWAVKYEKV